MKAEGKNGLTFGTSATGELHPEANLGGWRVKMMKKGYKMITKKTGLTKRAEFRVSCDFSIFCCSLRTIAMLRSKGVRFGQERVYHSRLS